MSKDTIQLKEEDPFNAFSSYRDQPTEAPAQEPVVENSPEVEQKTEDSEQVLDSEKSENVFTDQDNTESKAETEEVPEGEANTDEEFSFTLDDNTESSTNSSSDTFDYKSELGKALDSEFKSDQDVLDYVSNLKNELEKTKDEIKNVDTAFADETLKKANELAKMGGDWRSLLQISSVDYDQIDDNSLIAEVRLRKLYGDDNEKIKGALSEMSDYQKRLEAYNIREELKQKDEAQRADLFKHAEEDRKKKDSELQNAYKSTDNFFGYKLAESDKKKGFQDITNGKFNLFYDDKGNFTPKKVILAEWILRQDSNGKFTNLENLVKLHSKKGNVEGTRKVLDEASNTNIETRGQSKTPPSKGKEQSRLSQLTQYMKENDGRMPFK